MSEERNRPEQRNQPQEEQQVPSRGTDHEFAGRSPRRRDRRPEPEPSQVLFETGIGSRRQLEHEV